jgi:putative transposase
MKLLDAQLAAGVKVNAAQFAREHGVSARTVYRHRARVLAEGEWRERCTQTAATVVFDL